MDVAGAAGQLVFDGTIGVFPGPGVSGGVASLKCGDNRGTAQLVSGAAGPGVWRLEVSGPFFEPGSLRALGGHVILGTGNSLVFRLAGTPGERVAFAFRTHPRH